VARFFNQSGNFQGRKLLGDTPPSQKGVSDILLEAGRKKTFTTRMLSRYGLTKLKKKGQKKRMPYRLVVQQKEEKRLAIDAGVSAQRVTVGAGSP